MSNDTKLPDHIREFVRLRERARDTALTREERQALARAAIRTFTRTVRDENDRISQRAERTGIHIRFDQPTQTRECVQTRERLRDATMSTEYPVLRSIGGGYTFHEVLVHKPESCRLGYVTSGRAPCLVQHDHSRQAGVIDAAGLLGAKLRGTLRFGHGKDGGEMWRDVEDRIRRNVSLGYNVDDGEYITREGQPDLMLVTLWEPIECSLVSVGADPDAILD